jgi:hypothetical protein
VTGFLDAPGRTRFRSQKPGFTVVNLATRIIAWLRPAAFPRAWPITAPAHYGNRRRTAGPALLTGVIVFVVLQLGLGLAAEQSLLIKDPSYADREVRLKRLETAIPGAPVVLMMGTSRTGFGFHAGRIRGRLAAEGTRAVVYNFGIPASGPVTHLIYLRRLLADGHRPDLLLLEILPPGLAELPNGPLESRFVFGDRLRHHELAEVSAYGFPAEQVREKWWGSILTPWHTLRFPLMGRISPSALPWYLRFDWSRTADEYGWGTPLVDEIEPAVYEAGLTRAAAEYSGVLADLRIGAATARALADLLTLCRERGIPVRLVLMPEAPEFRALYSPVVIDRLHVFLRGLCAEFGCDLVDARAWLPRPVFTDGHHLLRPGAEAFSDRLTRDVIGPFLSGR